MMTYLDSHKAYRGVYSLLAVPVATFGKVLPFVFCATTAMGTPPGRRRGEAGTSADEEARTAEGERCRAADMLE